MKRKTKTASGGARLTASGKEPMLIGWEPEEKQRIKDAAKRERRPMTQFVMFYALQAAEKILEKS